MPIVTTEDTRHGSPRIEGTRITVVDVYIRVCELDKSKAEVADAYNIDIEEVDEALSYYEEHQQEMEIRREKRDELHEELESQESRL